MMIGKNNEFGEPIVRLTVRDVDGLPHPIDAVVATGYEGFLTVSPALVRRLRLPWLCRQQGQCMFTGVQIVDVHLATLIWLGRPTAVAVEVRDDVPLIGMSLLEGTTLMIRGGEGGAINISGPACWESEQRVAVRLL